MPERFSFRKRVQSWLRRRGLVVVSSGHAAERYVEFPPHSAFDSVLLRTFPKLDELTFIQIGANDGTRADPLARYLGKCRWSGVMFEPSPRHFAALRALHGDNSRIRLRQAAVDRTAGRRVLFDVPSHLPGLPDWAHGLTSFDRDHVENGLRALGHHGVSPVAHPVDTVAWQDVWRELDGSRCDMVVIDTEGFDIQLLRMAGLAERLPRLIHFEHSCAPTADRFAFYRELIELGYDVASFEGDTTASLGFRPTA